MSRPKRYSRRYKSRPSRKTKSHRKSYRKTRKILGGTPLPPQPPSENTSLLSPRILSPTNTLIYTPAPPPPPSSPPNEKKKINIMLEQAQDLLKENNSAFQIRFPSQLKAAVKKQNTENTDVIFNNEQMVKGLGNKDFMNLLFEDIENTNFRKVVEKLSASNQCKSVLGPCPKQCICWLCGEEIIDETPECEHILPISRTILFSGLKSTQKIEKNAINSGQNPNEVIKEYHKLSYDYAHPACNRTKSDTVLIQWDNDTNRIIFDVGAARTLARKILGDKAQDTQDPQVANLVGKYRDKMNALIEPINLEIESVLKLDGATMDLYWAYTLNIMKYYVLYEYLLENGKISEIDKIKTQEQLVNSALDDAEGDVETYRKNLSGVKKNLGSLFRSETTINKETTGKRKSTDDYPPLNRTKSQRLSLQPTKSIIPQERNS